MNDFYTIIPEEENWKIKKNEYHKKDNPICVCRVVGNAKLISTTPQLYKLFRLLEDYFYSTKSLNLNFDEIEKLVIEIKKKIDRDNNNEEL